MKAQRTPILGSLAGLTMLAVGWLFFAPMQLGGSSSYSVTHGNSMEPLLQQGNLAVERAASSYRVGDVVLYRSPSLHTTVLHRILVIQNGHYFFKGDNNAFVDPGYVTRSQLVGKLWFHVPHVGTIVSWVGRPLHAAVISAVVVLLLGLGGAVATRGRRRGGRPSSTPRAAFRTTAHDLRGHPGKTFGTLIVLFALAALLLGIGFATPAHRTVTVSGEYQHRGSFDYAARTTKPSTAYPNGVAVTGQPLFFALFKRMTLRFTYKFESRLPHDVHGWIQLNGVMQSEATGWHNRYTVIPVKPFEGDTATASGVVDLQGLQGFVEQLATTSGTVGADLSVALKPVVHVLGTVGGQPIDETFTPSLAATVSQSALKLAPAVASTLPGASYATPSSGDVLQAALNPVQLGTTRAQAVNYVTAARYHIAVPLLRLLGLIALALVSIAAVIHHEVLGRHVNQPLEDRIAHNFGSVVVPVTALLQPDGPTPVEVPDFKNLAGLAHFLERPILSETRDGARVFAVDDGSQRYVHRVQSPEQAAEPAVAKQPVAPVFPRARRRLRTGWVAGVLVTMAVTVTLATAFTATNTVAPSRAGTSTQALALAQLAPAECAGINLARLVVATSATTNGTAQNELILGQGSAGTFTLNGKGGTDCIVAGGGASTTNTLSGGNGADICIAPAAAHNTFKNCSNH